MGGGVTLAFPELPIWTDENCPATPVAEVKTTVIFSFTRYIQIISSSCVL